jgi:hypothetical protein
MLGESAQENAAKAKNAWGGVTDIIYRDLIPSIFK